jgi:glucose-1-phosphate cytidylyltransferase
MKYFSSYGINEFIICAGYKQYVIKEYFSDYFLHMSDVTFDFTQGNNEMIVHNNSSEPWKVTIVDTGLNTMTGGRIKRISKYLQDEPFIMTYGDGVSDVDINALITHHQTSGKLATLTAIQPGGRFGMLELSNDNLVEQFKEKSVEDGGWINGGFMVLQPEVLNYIKDDSTIFERDPLETLASQGQLSAYKHYGFWQCMDTLRDKELLDKLWKSNDTPWRKW